MRPYRGVFKIVYEDVTFLMEDCQETPKRKKEIKLMPMLLQLQIDLYGWERCHMNDKCYHCNWLYAIIRNNDSDHYNNEEEKGDYWTGCSFELQYKLDKQYPSDPLEFEIGLTWITVPTCDAWTRTRYDTGHGKFPKSRIWGHDGTIIFYCIIHMSKILYKTAISTKNLTHKLLKFITNIFIYNKQ